MALGVLGGKWGSVSILCYLLLGLAGMPVFTGLRGGPGVLLGPTGGYLWGFLAAGLCYRALERRSRYAGAFLGLLACYGCGTGWFLMQSGSGSLGAALLGCVVPFLLPDLLKLLLALHLAPRLRRRLPGHNSP